jgi:DNA-binding response OmpR family regulator
MESKVVALAARMGTIEQSPHILVVEGAPRAQRMIALQVERMGYGVTAVAQGAAALTWARRAGLPNLVILAQSLPDMPGMDVVEQLHATGQVPVLLLTSPTDPPLHEERPSQARTATLRKPFVFAELMRAVQQLLCPAETSLSSVPEECALDATVQINFHLQQLTVAGRQIALTPTETRLLQLLYAQRGRVVSPGYLMSKAWEPELRGTLGSLWVHIRRLRNKLEPNPEAPNYLITVRGQGYYLHGDPHNPP